jgi:hypothetical protein
VTPYVVTVFFAIPQSVWMQQIKPLEIIFQKPTLSLWHARRLAQQQIGNTGRCGYVIARGDKIVEKFDAPICTVEAA